MAEGVVYVPEKCNHNWLTIYMFGIWKTYYLLVRKAFVAQIAANAIDERSWEGGETE